MHVELKFFEAAGLPHLGRFMDDFHEVHRKCTEKEEQALLNLLLIYLPRLRDYEPDDLRDYLAQRAVWDTVDDIPVYRAGGKPCVFFCAIEHTELDCIAVYALGAAYDTSGSDSPETIKQRLAARLAAV